MSEQGLLHVGKISGVFGIKGWVKVFSFMNYREDILRYSTWILKKNAATKFVNVVTGQLQNQSVIAQLEDIDDRNAAELLIGWGIFIQKSQLAPTQDNEYYWSDLVGLRVENTHGIMLGVIDSLIETGSNDVMIINDENNVQYAIPFIQPDVVLEVDLNTKKMRVDWDTDF